MNNLQLKTRIAQNVGIASSGDDSAEEWQRVQDEVNEAIVDILLRTRINMRGVTLNLTAGIDEYEFGSSVLQIHNLYRGTQELEEAEPGDISRYQDISAGGAYAVVGYNRIALSWLAAAGETLEAWYTPAPTPMTADTHDPSTATYGNIPLQFHQAIVNRACWYLADYAGDQGSGRGDKYKTWYEGKEGDCGPGTDIGRIRTFTNRRLNSGSRRRRRSRAAQAIVSDAYPNFWVG